jgi:hypothetical protein
MFIPFEFLYSTYFYRFLTKHQPPFEVILMMIYPYRNWLIMTGFLNSGFYKLDFFV